MNFFENWYRLVNKYNQKTKIPKTYGTDDLLYPSEIHLIDTVGSNEKITTTKLSEILCITKGAVSQTTNKLCAKGMIEKNDSSERSNEVFITLTEKGKTAFEYHRNMHSRMMKKIDSIINELPDESIMAMQRIMTSIDEALEEI